MKLPTIVQNVQTMCLEFDVWITASLGEIKDTSRFNQEMDTVVEIFEIMGTATKNFSSIENCNPQALATM